MTRASEGFSVSRHLVSVLDDGSIVVQWGDARVQDILSGDYRTLQRGDHARPVMDGELDALRMAGRVLRYNRAYVWLRDLPEQNRFPDLHTQERSQRRVRSFYLNTTLPDDQVDDVRMRLHTLGLAADYAVTEHGGLVAIMRPDGSPFPDIKAAENAQRELVLQAYDLFKESAVAFVDTVSAVDEPEPKIRTMDLTNLGAIIASQTDRTLTLGKRAVLAVTDSMTRQPMLELLSEMGIEALLASTAHDALTILEDQQPELLVVDLQLPDMHAWELIAKAREIAGLENLLTAVIAPPASTEDRQAFGSTLAEVDAYLTSPFSMARFRLSIWLAFKHQAGVEY